MQEEKKNHAAVLVAIYHPGDYIPSVEIEGVCPSSAVLAQGGIPAPMNLFHASKMSRDSSKLDGRWVRQRWHSRDSTPRGLTCHFFTI
jgi:hypothetical protein